MYRRPVQYDIVHSIITSLLHYLGASAWSHPDLEPPKPGHTLEPSGDSLGDSYGHDQGHDVLPCMLPRLGPCGPNMVIH